MPAHTAAAFSRYRAPNDPSNQAHKKFLLADTPGHGKLRHHAVESIDKPQNIVGIIFIVDATDLVSDSSNAMGDDRLHGTASYLHDILLLLQKKGSEKRHEAKHFQVLIAANKQDLFTALPAPLIRTTLEREISRVRSSRSRGLLDSGIGLNDVGEEKEWLGEAGDTAFSFDQLREANIVVTVSGGNVAGSDEPNVRPWWDWISSNL